jgi:hypothetical protein
MAARTIIGLVVLLACVAFLAPLWWVFAVIGLAAGWGWRLSIRSWGWASLVIVVVIVVALWGLLLPALDSARKAARRSATQPVNYTARMDHHLAPQPWKLDEKVVISPWDWERLLVGLRGTGLAGADDETIKAGREAMEKIGWPYTGAEGSSDRFERSREVHVSARWVLATTSVTIPVDIGTLAFPKAQIELRPSDGSQVVVDSPSYTVAATVPPCTDKHDTHPGEQLTVPIGWLPGRGIGFKLVVLSPLLRWALGPQVARLSLWWGGKWLVLAVCFVFSEQIREKLLRPAIAPLVRRIGLKKPASKRR